MIKNVIFDLGGVLLDIDLPYCIQRVQALGVDINALSAIPAPELATDTKPAVMGEGMVANGILHLYQVGGISTSDFIKGIQHLCRPRTSYEQVLEAWNACCINIPQKRLGNEDCEESTHIGEARRLAPRSSFVLDPLPDF